jgi:hypothetical protein
LPPLTAFVPTSPLFTSPFLMSSEKTVFEPVSATAEPPVSTRKSER